MKDVPEHIQLAFQSLYAAGLFEVQEGKATVHIKGGVVMGVQLETWTYQKGREKSKELSTPSSSAKREVVP